jgi:hypothetical protein
MAYREHSTKKSLVQTTSAADAAQQRGPVRVHVLDAGINKATIQIAVDYEKAEVPERAYYADYSEIVRARSGISLFFGKLIPGRAALRTKVEISFPREMFMRQFWAGSRDFHETLRLALAKTPVESVSGVSDTEKVQTFRSNNVFMAMLGEESLMDFYYIPPSDIHYVRTGRRNEVFLQAVIRISMATPILYDFLEQCRTLVEGDVSLQTILESEGNE